MWNPYIKIGEMSKINKRGERYVDFIRDIDIKQRTW